MTAPNAITQACLLNAVGGNPLLVAYPTITLLYEAIDVQPYNLNIPVVPAAVTFPETAAQVSAIVQCAANGGYKVQAKSGGHSYGNYCEISFLSPPPPTSIYCLFLSLFLSSRFIPCTVLLITFSLVEYRFRRRRWGNSGGHAKFPTILHGLFELLRDHRGWNSTGRSR